MTNKKNQKIAEEISRNYHTIDPEPIDFFHDPRIAVEIYPGGKDGKYMVDMSCEDLEFKSPTRTFFTEPEAQNWARNMYTSLITKLNNLEESIYTRVVSRILDHRD